MKNDILLPLLNNAVLLLALATVYDLLSAKTRSGKPGIPRKIASGLALGLLGIGLILASVHFIPGIVFDTRSVLLSVSGLFFGLIPTLIAMVMTATFRLWQGGTGAYVGALTVIATGSIGLIWRRMRRKPLDQISSGELYFFGILNHIVMLAIMLLLPFETARDILTRIGGPVLLTYPLVTLALGRLLAARLRHERTAVALAESETMYRNIFDNNHAVMLLIDPETGAIVDANPAAVHFYGWSNSQLRRMNISEINTLPLEKIQAETCREQRLENPLFHFSHRLADGSVRDVDVLSGLVTISERKLLYSIVWDATERNRIEAEREKLLAEAEQARVALLSVIEDQKRTETRLQRLSMAIEQSPEIVIITDADGNIQYVNPAFTSVTGYSREETLGRNPRILQGGKHDAAFYSDLWTTLRSGRIWTGRFINKRKNGELYTEEASISPVRDSSGTITSYVAVNRDVTAELIKEEQFRQSQKMEAVGQLAGGIAHDFNNILQAIQGFSEILLTRLTEESPEHRNALEIQKAAKRAAEMTRQLLAFSRKQPVDKKRINLNAAIRDSEVLLQLLLGEKTHCTLELAPDLNEVYADHSQLTQIVMNLAVNARDAMPNGGRLTVSTQNITFEHQALAAMPEAEPGTFVCLSITDTGCGMSKEEKDHLFEPFFTTKAVGQGTGLGLAVVYGIVKQNKGWIHVYSETGQGTSFKIYLPACGAAPPAEQLPEKNSGRILLVEDDTDTRNMVIRILSPSNYETVAAASAEEALELYDRQKGRFDLLFSDMILPNKGGLELADELREKNPTLPILLYSGYQDQRKRWINLESKGYHFLQKPFTLTGLLAAVHDAMAETPR